MSLYEQFMNLNDLSQPSFSISLNALQEENKDFKGDKLKHSLAVNNEKESYQPPTNSLIIKSTSDIAITNPALESPLLDIQSIDFLSTEEAVKQLFTLPYIDETAAPCIAIHRMGSLLLLDDIKDKFNSQMDKDGFTDSLKLFPSLLGQLTSSTSESTSQETAIYLKSPFVPPPSYFIPKDLFPSPHRQVLNWQVSDMKLAVDSNTTIYNTSASMETPRVMTFRSVDTSEELELSTCLDLYLDNVMANVPELALALHSKGFIHSLKVCKTANIPYLNISKLSENSNTNVFQDAFIGEFNEPIPSKPLFDPKTIDMDATTIMRFLKSSCHKEDGTYLLTKSSNGQSLQLYDLSQTNIAKQRKFKFMLAMISYRFAVRLGYHIPLSTLPSRIQLQHRQNQLFQTCNDLLVELIDLGGEKHHTIRASVLEQLADIHMTRVNEMISLNSSTKQTFPLITLDTETITSSELSDSNTSSSQNSNLSDMYDFMEECQQSLKHLFEGIQCLRQILNEKSEPLDNLVMTEVFDQYSGICHKLIQMTDIIILEHLKNVQIIEAIRSFSSLIEVINYWVCLFLQLDETSQKLKKKVISYLLPKLWNALGEIIHEAIKQSLFSMEEEVIKCFQCLHMTSLSISSNYNISSSSKHYKNPSILKTEIKVMLKRRKATLMTLTSCSSKDLDDISIQLDDLAFTSRNLKELYEFAFSIIYPLVEFKDVLISFTDSNNMDNIPNNSINTNETVLFCLHSFFKSHEKLGLKDVRVNYETFAYLSCLFMSYIHAIFDYNKKLQRENNYEVELAIDKLFHDRLMKGLLRKLGDAGHRLTQLLMSLVFQLIRRKGNLSFTFINLNQQQTIQVNMFIQLLTSTSRRMACICRMLFHHVQDPTNEFILQCAISAIDRLYAMNLISPNSRFQQGAKEALICLETSYQHLKESSLQYSLKHPFHRIVHHEIGLTLLCCTLLQRSQLFIQYQYYNEVEVLYCDEYIQPFKCSSTCQSNESKECLKVQYQELIERFQLCQSSFTITQNWKYAALVSYYLGGLYSFDWKIQRKTTTTCSNASLELAIQSYQQAHGYFIKNELGPYVIMILFELSDLYFVCYEASHDMNIYILLRALQAIVECRFATTLPVIERYGSQVMSPFISMMSSKLMKLLQSLLKALQRNDIQENEFTSKTDILTFTQDIKSNYQQLLRCQDLQQIVDICELFHHNEFIHKFLESCNNH